MTRPARVPLPSFDLASWLLPHHQTQEHSDERAVVPPPEDAVPPRQGWARPYGGRAPLTPRMPVFRGSTAEVQGLYPWLYGVGLPAAGAYLRSTLHFAGQQSAPGGNRPPWHR